MGVGGGKNDDKISNLFVKLGNFLARITKLIA